MQSKKLKQKEKKMADLDGITDIPPFHEYKAVWQGTWSQGKPIETNKCIPLYEPSQYS